jgi:hypothetical protein
MWRVLFACIVASLPSVAIGGGSYPSVGPRAEFFQGLKQPDTGISCCSISDCKRTEADWRSGQWWAKVIDQWTPIPPGKVLTNKSIDGDAYVCSNSARDIYCFVPPDRGF